MVQNARDALPVLNERLPVANVYFGSLIYNAGSFMTVKIYALTSDFSTQ